MKSNRAHQAALLVCGFSNWFLQAHALDENRTCDAAWSAADHIPRGFALLQSVVSKDPHGDFTLDIRKSLQAVQPPKPKAEHKPEHKAAEAEHEADHRQVKIVTVCCASLILSLATIHLIQSNHITVLPPEFMIMVYGFLAGLLLKYWAGALFMQGTNIFIRPPEVMALLFLPPIIFDSGFMMRRLDFMSQLPYILIFAVIGTLINAAVIGLGIRMTGNLGYHSIRDYRSAFTIAAAISAVDAGPVLAAYTDLKVEPLLTIMVSGESLLNDLVAVVLFKVLNHGADLEVAMHQGLSDSMTMFFGSVSVGIMVGVFTCWLLRFAHMHSSKKLEILITFLTAYMAFALGEYWGFSGIIATLINGLLMGVYARAHLSMEGSLLSGFFLGQCCTIIDTGIYLLCGMSLVLVWTNGPDMKLSWILIILCLMARALAVISCGWCTNAIKSWHGMNQGYEEKDWHILSSGKLFMIWHAGIHGAVALWLTMHIGEWMDHLEEEGTRHSVESAVLVLMIVLTGVLGGTTELCLEWFEIKKGQDYNLDYLSKTELPSVVADTMRWLHENMFGPALVGSRKESEESFSIEARLTRRMDVELLLKHVTESRSYKKEVTKEYRQAVDLQS